MVRSLKDKAMLIEQETYTETKKQVKQPALPHCLEHQRERRNTERRVLNCYCVEPDDDEP
jgi:hypothetical protein